MNNSIWVFSLLLSITLASCSSQDDGVIYDEKQDDLIAQVDYATFNKECEDLESKILSSSNPDKNLMQEATTKFQDYAGYFPTDPKAPEYLFKASDYALALGQPEKSIKILERIMKDYPSYNRMEDVMYNRADHLDFNLRDTTRAKEAYQEFITKYPQSDLVDDAQSRIENIGLSLEELADKFIQDLEKQPQ